MTGKQRSLALGDHFDAFVEEKIAEGRFSDASDVVRAGLRLLEDQEAKVGALRAALERGEESGVSPRDVRDIWASVKGDARADENG